jgi:HD-like signal output (HDOD) protein
MKIDLSQLAFPHVSPDGLKALNIIAQPEPSIHELQAVILSDPILAGMLIRHANSPLYRRSQPITNVPAAIRALGFKSIRSAVVMATLHSNDLAGPANQPVWEHSTATALAARIIAQHILPAAADDLEFLGLIHDVGMLVLASNFPQQYQQILQRSEAENLPVDQIELEVFGLQHSSIMNSFLAQFRLPPGMIELLTSFHCHTAIEGIENDDQRQLCIIDMSHYLLDMIDRQRHVPYQETIIEPLSKLQLLLAIDDELLEQLRQEIEDNLSE